ncbi:Type II secretion system protein E [Rubripirellula lacrimiformis]|uniref:Type II secretion system protein E n=1 Tax=Rubripirellula lacrimiformis TaxID=1930273 RepID=A0A517NHS7_9BACT|nr:GspE/PulE family protein [Rubripirellula lacrimiformis]QDT06691.1 Type II secretion system protein E [Rubripirellula lacrimiformis]
MLCQPAIETADDFAAAIALPASRSHLRIRKQGALLGERLIEAGLLRPDQLESALEHQKVETERMRLQAEADGTQRSKRGRFKRLGEVITELGLVDEGDLIPHLGEQLGVEGVRLREGLIDPLAVGLVPRDEAERLRALPLMRVRDELTVAMADPHDLSAIDSLARISGCRIRPVFTLAASIDRLLPRCYEDDFAVDSVTADLDVEQLDFDAETIDLDLSGSIQLAEGSPVINLVNYAIVQAIGQGASDIHIEPGAKCTSVRFRIDGALREVMKPRKDLHSAIVSRIKVMAKLDIAEHRQPQDGRLHVRMNRREVDLRVSTLPTVLGEKVVMRVLDRQSVTFDLNRLGMADESLAIANRMLRRPHGLVLVTGPTGSGKTTTLYSAIEMIKGVQRNIITVENPVEYQLELINQVQVQSDTGMSFAKALRSILRQDPDVIMVGEIRDRETAETAIQAALTGHLVLSTLHTNDSASAITRLVDMGIERFKISAALVGVIAQRLVRNLCPSCRETYYPSARILSDLQFQGDTRHPFAQSRGCSQCFESGYRGRTGIYEMLECNSSLRTMINDDANLDDIRAAHRGPTLLSEGLRLAVDSVTSLDEVTRVALVD